MQAERLEIRLLGEFALLRNGRELPTPTLKKARILVGRLALNPGHEFLRDDLAVHLWPDSEIETARFNLRQLIARIRRAAPDLSPCIVAEDRTTIRFDATDALIDAREFRRLAGSLPEEAVSHYRGPLLDGIEDGWIDPPRAELEELYLRTLESLADLSEAREAVPWLRRARETDPYREPLLQKLLIRLAECGDLAGVQVAYRTFQDLLHREMNAIPSHETVRLYRRLLSDEQAPSDPGPAQPVVRSRLPVPTNEIIGREEEVQEVCELLRGHRLVTLVGAGGSGKTRLSIAIGAKELEHRAKGVWFVDLSPVVDPLQVPQTVGQALGLREPSGMGWAEALIENIGSSDRLVILDNCEHLVEACSRIAGALLAQCEGLRILATSRVPLALDGEQRFSVPSLEIPSEAEMQLEATESEYLRFSAVRLFVDRARLVSPRFAIDAETASRVVSICREVDAMPLGIEMAAARLAGLSLTEVARRLDDKLAFLRGPARNAVPRHQTLGAVIEWSYDLLSEDGRTLLRRLSVFGGGWTLDSATAVCGFGTLQPETILEALVGLTEASLVQHRDDRYSFLDTVRSFARFRLGEGVERDTARDRHLQFFHEFCEGVEALVAAEGPERAAVRYRHELDNVRAALAWAAREEASHVGLLLAANASVVLSISHLDGEAVGWLQRILELPVEDPGSPARTRALKRACTLFQSNFLDLDRSIVREKTVKVCRELVGIAELNHDLRSLAHGLAELGNALQSTDLGFGRECLERSLEIFGSLPDGGRAQWPMVLLGFSDADAGEFEEARRRFQRSERLAQQAGDTATRLFALQAESHLLREHCRYPEALLKLQEIERILASWPDARVAALKDLRLAELALATWDLASMAAPLRRAQVFYEGSRIRFQGMLVDGLFRYLAAYEGRIGEAVTGLSSTLANLISGGYSSSHAWWHGAAIELEALSLAASRAGDPAAGSRVFGAAQALRERDGAHLSPNIRSRWDLLSKAAGFGTFTSEIEEGHRSTPEEAIALAEELERSLLSGPTRSV